MIELSAVAPNIASHQQTVYAEDGIGSTVLGQYGNRRSGDSAAPASEMDSTEVIWLPTATGPMPVAAQINGRLYAIDADHLNTPRRLTNAQGQVVWQWLITGFGEANPTTGATGYAQDGTASGRSYGEQVRFDLRYPGQVWDEETGLSYNLHRYYDAGTGRYVQADPIGLEGGWNRFGYVGADPVNSIDPQGLNAQVFVAGAPILTVGCVVSLGCRQMISNAAQSLADRLSNLIFNRPSKTPNSGDPGSCHVNPGSGQERWYGEDGLPEADRDWDKHHGPNTEVPHGHNWSRDENGRPVRGGSNPYSWALGSKVI